MDEAAEIPLTSQHLTCPPREWITQLYAAALEANIHLVMQIVREISQTETDLIQSLTQLARQFQFEQLVALAEPLISHD